MFCYKGYGKIVHPKDIITIKQKCLIRNYYKINYLELLYFQTVTIGTQILAFATLFGNTGGRQSVHESNSPHVQSAATLTELVYVLVL